MTFRTASLLLIVVTILTAFFPSRAQVYDLVILNGRVIDPESQTDALRNVGINKGKIEVISQSRLNGKNIIDASGLVVSPGFIDLHQHGQNEENYRLKVLDGVTSALELEVGTGDVDRWYAERKGKSLINYGVSVGHLAARMAAMKEPVTFVPTGEAARRAATDEEISEMADRIDKGLRSGAIAVGFGLQYTPKASQWEVLELFRVAARFNASCHVHLRHAGAKDPGSIGALQEVVSAAAITGAPLHVVHIHSTGGPATPKLLQMISELRRNKFDITTECYPYIAGMTDIKSAIFNEGWQEVFGIDYKDLQWAATGERLTKESFEKYRQTGGMVAVFSMTEENVRDALHMPLTMIASDGIMENGKGHPRTAGTYSRVLGKYVREEQVLTLIDALAKMTLMPAKRLERRVPSMNYKGRLRAGADADITIFHAESINDRATFQEPAREATGVKYVIVNGVVVVKDGKVQPNVHPGGPIRAPF